MVSPILLNDRHLKLHLLALCIAYATERQILLAERTFLKLYWLNEEGASTNKPHPAGHTQTSRTQGNKANGYQLEAWQSTWDPAGPETGSQEVLSLENLHLSEEAHISHANQPTRFFSCAGTCWEEDGRGLNSP